MSILAASFGSRVPSLCRRERNCSGCKYHPLSCVSERENERGGVSERPERRRTTLEAAQNGGTGHYPWRSQTPSHTVMVVGAEGGGVGRKGEEVNPADSNVRAPQQQRSETKTCTNHAPKILKLTESEANSRRAKKSAEMLESSAARSGSLP